MKRNYIAIFIYNTLLLVCNQVLAQTTTTTTTINGKTTATATTTVGGKTYSASSAQNGSGASFSSVVTNGPQTTFTFLDNADDTTKWKTREISKDFNISSNAPIFIESTNRNIEIKTWDQPNVRIVANARYKDDKDANLSFDDVFERNNIKIKNSDQAFEVLGANSTFNMNYDYTFSSDNAPKSIAISGKSGARSLVRTDNNIRITTPDYSDANGGDTVRFHDDSTTTDLRILLKSVETQKKNQVEVLTKAKEMQERAIATSSERSKKQEETKKAKIAALSKQMESLSKKLAALSLNDAEGNNKEISRLNQEIGKLSNQIAFQSIGNNFIIKLDTAKTRWNMTSPMKIDVMESPTVFSFTPSHTFSAFYPNKNTSLKWTIYIPRTHKVSIDSKYGNISIDNDIDNAKIISKYGNIETKNIGNLTIQNEYGNVYTNNVKNGDIEIRGGALKMQDVENLKIDSKNANIDLNEVSSIQVESSNDNYDVSAIQNLSANKNYGSFRLTALKGKMNFNGINADLKIRSISPNVTNIDITNKFAKISLPFSDIKNYNIAVNGSFNDSFDDFNKQSNNGKGFTATGGNGKDLTTNINCNNCQLDFK
ncbi:MULTISPECIES: hypothetical protein [Chitinophagaceae]